MAILYGFVAILGATYILPSRAVALERSERREVGTENKFIISLKDGLSQRDINAYVKRVDAIHERSLGRRDLNLPGIEKKIDIGNFHVIVGGFDEATIQKIKNSPEVADVEPDQLAQISAIITQPNAPYGLAAISSQGPGSTDYPYDASAGKGTFAYIVDTGIRADHEEFGGRVTRGFTAFNDSDIDITGHGTMVAGVLGSKTYGVAKLTNIIDVKIFETNTTSYSIGLAGYAWAVNDIISNRRANRSVINLSFGVDSSTILNKAVESAFQSGILTIAAAGNHNKPTANYSPASSPNAITVGAIDKSWKMATFSNFGPEVDILAPGDQILTTHIGSTTATITENGTSFAAPHVAGIALYLAALENINSPSELTKRILALGTRDKATDLKSNTVNLVANNGALTIDPRAYNSLLL